MFARNNWIYSNIKQRMVNPTLDLSVYLDLKDVKIENIKFEDACNMTAYQIKKDYSDKKIYISFSGGMDSENIIRVFHRNNIEFYPIIVVCNDNRQELKYAFKTCFELKLKPIILKMSDKHLQEIVFIDILNKLKGVGIYSAQHIFASRYVNYQKGILVNGAEMLVNTEGTIFNIPIGLLDVEIYTYALLSNTSISIPFYFYTPQIFYSYVRSIDETSNETIQQFKSTLYNIENRIKYRPIYNDRLLKMMLEISNINKKISKNYCILGSKSEVIRMFENKK